MDRLFGIDASILDRSTPKAVAQLQAELIQAIRKFEPRCRVQKVSFDGDINGRLTASEVHVFNSETGGTDTISVSHTPIEEIK